MNPLTWLAILYTRFAQHLHRLVPNKKGTYSPTVGDLGYSFLGVLMFLLAAASVVQAGLHLVGVL